MDDSWRRNRFSAMTAIPSHPERAIPFASSSLMIPRRHPHRGHPFFAGNADSLMSIQDWYSRFARLTGIMRKYMPGFVRWNMTMVSPSPVSCAVGHIENSSHNNTIHDFMISRWQNSVIPQSIFNVWHNSEKQSVFCRDYGFPIGNHCITQSQFQSDNMAIDWIRLKAIHYSFNALHFSFRISVIIVFFAIFGAFHDIIGSYSCNLMINN